MTISLRYLLATSLVATFALCSSVQASPEAAGSYGGVLEPSLSDPPENSGLINLHLNKEGTMSGVLIWQGQRYPFKGPLTEVKPFSRVFEKKLSSSPIDLRVFMALSGPSRFVNGTLSEEQNGSTNSTTFIGLTGAKPDPVLMEKLRPGLRISFIDAPNPTTEGEGPLLGPLPGPAVEEISADGFVHVRIARSKKRSSRLVGRLPDAAGTFTAGSPLRGSNYAIFSSLYKKKRIQGGQLFGDANVFDTGDQPPDFFSSLRWGKAANPESTFYPGPFNFILSLDAVPYPKVKPGRLVPLLPQASPIIAPLGVGPEPTNAINARILFRRGNISLPDGAGGFERFFRQNIKITPFHTRVVGDNPHQVKIHVDAFSGRFRGTFKHPILNAKTRFRGAFQAAVLFTPGQGRGHFRPPSGPGITPLAEPLESGGVRINVN